MGKIVLEITCGTRGERRAAFPSNFRYRSLPFLARHDPFHGLVKSGTVNSIVVAASVTRSNAIMTAEFLRSLSKSRMKDGRMLKR